MENTAPAASARAGRKRKASARDREVPNKKKRGGTKKAQLRSALNKSEKQRVLAALKKAVSSPNSLDQADSGKLLASVLQEVDSQLYIHTFPCRAEFWEKFKVTDLMAGICKALGELYCTAYKQCDKRPEVCTFSTLSLIHI